MKKLLISTGLISVLLALAVLTGVLDAQQQPQGATAGQTPTVAAIDVAKIFKGHTRLQAQQQGMKKDAEDAKAGLQKDRERIQAKMEQLKALKTGTPDYKRMEGEIVQSQAELATRAKLMEKDFAEREARNYFNAYREVSDEVKNFADYYRINVVLRYNSDQPDINDPQSVLRDINKPIVYLGPNLDITNTILNEINKRGGAPAANPASRPTGIQRPN